MDVCVQELNGIFWDILLKTSPKMRKPKLAELIANNTKITSLFIADITRFSNRRTELFEGLKRNTTLLKLQMPTSDDVELPNNGIKTLVLTEADDHQIIQMIRYNTTIQNLHIRGYKYINGISLFQYIENNTNILNLEIIPVFGTFHHDQVFCDYLRCLIKNDTLTSINCLSSSNTVAIRDLMFILLSKTNLKSLTIDVTLCSLNIKPFEQLNHNTTLESLHIVGTNIGVGDFSHHLGNNTSIINYCQKRRISTNEFVPMDLTGQYTKRNRELNLTGQYTKRNRELRWKHIHTVFLDLIITLYPIKVNDENLPPYVLLWIFDWLYPDNPYCKHFQKITFIYNVIQTLKKVRSTDIDI